MAIKKTHEQFLVELEQRNTKNPNYQIKLADGERYTNLSTKLRFECCNGHGIFETLPKYILTKGSGCPQCSSNKAGASNTKGSLEFLEQLKALNSPLEYVSGFIGMTKKATFRCTTCAHVWQTLPKTVVRGSGCPNCKIINNTKRSTLSWDDIENRIRERNSRTLGSIVHVEKNQQYLGTNHKLWCGCDKGHRWLTRPGDLWNNDAGCPQCAGTVKRNAQEALDDIRARWPLLQVASEHSSLLGRREEIEVMCENSHTWNSTYERLMAGHYCPHCYGNAKYTQTTFVEKLRKVNPSIEVLGTFEQTHTPIEVKCRTCSHEWKPRPYNLIQGYGCPQCSKNNKFSKKAISWLRYIEQTENIVIQHARNYGEFRVPGTKYRCDGFCVETNTIYEFYGDYWHGNPLTTNVSEYNVHVNKSFGELYKSTIEREQTLRELGYKLVSIWENDYDQLLSNTFLIKVLGALDVTNMQLSNNDPYRIRFETEHYIIDVINTDVPPNTDERRRHIDNTITKKRFVLFLDELITDSSLVAKKIAHYMQQQEVPAIHARKCVIKECSNQEKRELLNKNHVQGNDNAPIAYGAYYDDKLVAVMTFCKPRVALGQKNRDNITDRWELSRFCTDVNYRIPGIASKLLKHFQRNHQWVEIYSYADKRWSIGNMYHKLGFELVADNPPDYFYIIDGKRKHRWNYRKDILKNTLPDYDPKLTEYQNMVNHGYWRMWDCGTLKFSMKNPS